MYGVRFWCFNSWVFTSTDHSVECWICSGAQKHSSLKWNENKKKKMKQTSLYAQDKSHQLNTISVSVLNIIFFFSLFPRHSHFIARTVSAQMVNANNTCDYSILFMCPLKMSCSFMETSKFEALVHRKRVDFFWIYIICRLFWIEMDFRSLLLSESAILIDSIHCNLSTRTNLLFTQSISKHVRSSAICNAFGRKR